MSKLRKSILIIGILVIVVAASLATALALYATGSIKTDPIELEFRLRPQEKVYDGTPLQLASVNFDNPELSDIELTKGSTAAGHSIKVEFIGSQTNVGTSTSDATIKILDENGFNVTSDYAIKVEGAELKVTQKLISVELPSQEVVYNGSKVLFNEYETTEGTSLCAGHKIYGSTDAAFMNVGDTLPDDLTPLIYDVAGNNVTENYEIEFKKGEIKVIPRPITVRPVSQEKVYDGEEITAGDIEFVEGSLVDGQTYSVTVNNGYDYSRTDAGETEIEITELKIFDVVGGETVEVTDNYEFNLLDYTGLLKVTPRPLTVTAMSASFVYNGEEQSLADETQPLSVEGLAECDELLGVTYVGSRKNVGVSANVITEVSLRGLIDNYALTRVDGEIEITPFGLTYKTGSDEKYYDGEPLNCLEAEFTLANEGHRVIKGDGTGADGLPSITTVGEISNAYTVTIVDINDSQSDYTANYAITYDYGTLTVKRTPVLVTLKNGKDDREKVCYNSTSHMPTLGADGVNSAYFDVQPYLPETEEVTLNLTYGDFDVVPATRVMRDAGEYYYTVKFKDGSSEERKYYANYELFVPQDGILEVIPLPVNVKLNDYGTETPFVYSGKVIDFEAEKVIDKIELPEGVTLPEGVKLDDIIKKDDFSVVLKQDGVELKEIIDAGADYKYNVEITDGLKKSNFKAKPEDQNLTVNPMPVIVALQDVEHVYNGSLQEVGIDETFIYVKRILTEEQIAEEEDEDDVAGLTKKDLAVSFESDERINVADYSFVVTGIKPKTQNNYSISVADEGGIPSKSAKLSVKPFKMTIITNAHEFIYDGNAHRDGGFVYGVVNSDGTLEENVKANERHRVVRTSQDVQLRTVTNVADVKDNLFTLQIYNGAQLERNEVTSNYDIEYKYGKLTVAPRPVTISTDTPAAHVYDGEAFSSDKFTITEGLVSADGTENLTDVFYAQRRGAKFEITDVGREKNAFACSILKKSADGSYSSDVSENFDVSYDYGWLEVIPRAITLKTQSASKVYDGNPLSRGGVEIVEADLKADYRAQAAGGEPLSITDAGSIKNVFDCTILTAGNVDVTANFDISFDSDCGYLTVTPLPISLELSDFSESLNVNMYFDGKPKTFGVDEAVKNIKAAGSTNYALVEEKTDEGGVQFTEGDFEITYSSLIFGAGRYRYAVNFTDEEFAKNFSFAQDADHMKLVEVKKLPVIITLNSFSGDNALIYSSRAQKLDIYAAVNAIESDKIGDVRTVIKEGDLEFVYSEAPIAAGNYKYKVMISDVDYARNFDCTVAEAEIEIKKYTVYVNLVDCEADYSGAEYVFGDGAMSFVNDVLFNDEKTGEYVQIADVLERSDFKLAATDGRKIIDAGTYDFGASFVSEEDDGNFLIEAANTANVKINPIDISVTAKKVELTFNGEEQKLTAGVALGYDAATVPSDAFTFTTANPLRNAGDYSYTVTVNGNFILNGGAAYLSGNVTIKKYAVTVELNELKKTYDGAEYKVGQSDIALVSEGLFTEDYFTVEYDEVEGADLSTAGEHKLKVVFTKKYAEFTDNAAITVVNGKVTVEKRKITVTTPSEKFIYNGKAQSAPEATLIGAVAGHYAEVVEGSEATVTNVAEGKVDNKSQYKIFKIADGVAVDVTESYVIDEAHSSFGKLEVEKLAITIKTGSDKKEYDGAELICNSIESCTGLVDGHNVTVPSEEDYDYPMITELGTEVNEFDGVTVRDSDNADVTENYAITYEYGTLEIVPIEIKVTLYGDIAVTYTGERITTADVEVVDKIKRTVTPEGLISVANADFALIFSGNDGVNAGKYNFTLGLDDTHYNVTVEGECALTVDKYALSVTLNSYVGATAFVYNGEKQSAPENAIAEVGLSPDGIATGDFEFDYEKEMLNVGKYTFGVVLKDETKAGNYELNVTGGEYEITKLNLTVTLRDYEKIYSGKVYSVDLAQSIVSIKDAEGNANTLLSSSGLQVTYSEEIYLAREASYTYGVEIIDKQTAKNIELTVAGGNFKVTKRKITFTLDNLYISSQDYKSYGYANSIEFDVTDKVSISAHTPLAEGDELTIKKAVAEREDFTSNTLYLGSIDEYTLTNAGCYEFTNATAAVPVSAQLIIF